MELSRDTLTYIALMLELPEILTLCESSSKINQLLCQKQQFWYNKIKRDYPDKIIDSNLNYREIYKNLYIYPIEINLVINFQLDGENYNFSYLVVINENDKILDIGKYILYIVSMFSEGILINNKFDFNIYNKNKPKKFCEVIAWNNNNCLKNINYTTEQIVVDMIIKDGMDMSLNVDNFSDIVNYVKKNYLKNTIEWPPLWL